MYKYRQATAVGRCTQMCSRPHDGSGSEVRSDEALNYPPVFRMEDKGGIRTTWFCLKASLHVGSDAV
jgi:hypothetical protein